MSRRTLPIYLVAGALFAALSARGFLVPLFGNQLGADRTAVGLLFSVSTITAALVSLPSGLFTDRFGRRGTLVLAVVLAGASQVATALSSTVESLFLWQIVGGLAAGAANAALFAALADNVPADRLGRSMGWLTFAMQAGFLVGPAVAGAGLELMSLRTDIGVSSALNLVALGAAVMIESSGHQRATTWNLLEPLRDLARRKGFRAVTLGLLAATILWGTTQAYLPLFGKQVLGLPGSQIGYLIAILAVFNGLARPPGGRLVDRAPKKGPIVLVGVVGYSVAVLILPHLHGFWAPAVVMAIGVPFVATAFIAIGVSFSNLASAESRGVVMGVYGAILFFGLGVGPAVFGPLMQFYGYAAGYSAAAMAAVVLALLMALARREPAGRRGRMVAIPPPAPGT